MSSFFPGEPFHVKHPDVRPPDPPDQAEAVFGTHLDQARAFAELLAGPGVERGLLGPREVPRLWDRHLLNCGVLAPMIAAETTVGDVGSGAGLPGIVLAIARPDLHVVLVEPLLRRCQFLNEVVANLGLAQVEVCRSRAEELKGRQFGVVTARAVAPLERLLGWTLPLVASGGELLAMKGAGATDELRAAQSTLTRWPRATAEVVVVGEGLVDPATTVIRIRP